MRKFHGLLCSKITPLVIALTVMQSHVPLYSATAQQLPAHASDQLEPGYRDTTRLQVFQRGGSAFPAFDVGIITYPVYRESRFNNSWGASAGVQWFLAPPMSLRLGLDYESINASRQFSDAELVSAGLALNVDLARTSTYGITTVFAINHVMVDYEEGGQPYDDAVSAFVGLEYLYGMESGVGFGFGAGYRMNLEKPKTSDNQKVSLEGLQIRLKMQVTF